ncbi:MAG TPA: cytochrome c oxidase assembly protein [Acidimicrobiales bacterium]
MLAVAATADFWRWQPHPEVWLLVAALAAGYWYAVRAIGRRAVPRGRRAVTTGQVAWFAGALVVLEVAADWPMHDVAEEYLYSVHMVQHLLLTFVLPPMVLLATPEWLARLVVGDGRAWRWVRRLARPVVAGLVFNLLVAVSHWPAFVNLSVSSGPVHYGAHVVLVTAALLMWVPVAGPFPELRISLPGQMVYLFLMSIIPTIPAAWLTFADGVLFSAYDTPYRLWGVTVASDQQAAGLIMKLGGGAYLWTLITMLFFRWAARHYEADKAGVPLSERDVLTWEEVKAELDRLGPAPRPTTPNGS